MDQETMRNLRLDRRLLQRRGWVSPKELEEALEALPDVSGKIAPPAEEPRPAEAGASGAGEERTAPAGPEASPTGS